MFSERLDFIMRLTDISAGSLEKACHLSAAHIRRLRNGGRPLPKNPSFLHDMSAYLAENILDDYQRAAMCSKLQLSTWPTDKKEAADMMEKWLSCKEENLPDIGSLLLSFSGSGSKSVSTSEVLLNLPETKTYYYGIEGKREAVLQFFNLVLASPSPATLLLTSDEEMRWLYEDPAFAARWKQDFIKVLKKGNRVKIIHSIGRGMNEMLEALAKWIPIYSTGMIEPYYNPNFRDGMVRRTLFIAPGIAAVSSVSVEHNTEGMLNHLITNEDAIAALTNEFNHYFFHCRPLMHILTPQRQDEFQEIYNALLDASEDMVCMSSMPTLITMPEQVAVSMQERAQESSLLKQWKISHDFISNLTNGTKYTEILPLSYDMDDTHPISLPYADLLGAKDVSYTAREWQLHFDSAMHFSEHHTGYQLFLRSDIPNNICLFVKENCGVIMIKNDMPSIAFAISEPSIVRTFWTYMTLNIRT